MASKLPSFIRLPGHNKFEYKPRYYDPNEERREATRKRISFRKRHFQSDSPISDQFKREKVDIRKRYALVTILIRVVIVILLVAMVYLLFHGVALMKSPN